MYSTIRSTHSMTRSITSRQTQFQTVSTTSITRVTRLQTSLSGQGSQEQTRSTTVRTVLIVLLTQSQTSGPHRERSGQALVLEPRSGSGLRGRPS
jgi:hypothetical protein